jgi:hypothetical protein
MILRVFVLFLRLLGSVAMDGGVGGWEDIFDLLKTGRRDWMGGFWLLMKRCGSVRELILES